MRNYRIPLTLIPLATVLSSSCGTMDEIPDDATTTPQPGDDDLSSAGVSPSPHALTPSPSPNPGDDDSPPCCSSPTLEPSSSPAPMVSVTLLARYSRQPLAGVSVWLGSDGSGPVDETDENGEAHFFVASSIQDVSYGFAYETATGGGRVNEYRTVASFLGTDLQTNAVFILADATSQGDLETYAGQISGISDHEDTQIFAIAGQADGITSTRIDPSFESASFSLSAPPAQWLIATQSPFSDRYGYSASVIPLAFQLLLEPEHESSLELDRTFDHEVSLNLSNIDPTMTSSTHGLTIEFPSDGGAMYFADDLAALSDPLSQRILSPLLREDFPEITLTLEAEVTNAGESAGQSVSIPDIEGAPSLSVDFPSMHQLEAYAPLDGATLAGTQLKLTANNDSARPSLSYFDVFRNQVGDRSIRHSWTVQRVTPANSFAFPLIPTGAFDWQGASDDNSDYYTQAQGANIVVYEGASLSGSRQRSSWSTLRTTSPDAYEPNQSTSEATSLVTGIEHPVLNLSDTDEDWFTFFLDRTSSVGLHADGTIEGETELILYSNSLLMIFSDVQESDSSLDLNLVLDPAQYYVQIRDPNQGPFGNYTLSFSTAPAPDLYEPNDDPDTAFTVELDFLAEELSFTDGDKDYFALYLDAPTTVIVDTDCEALGEGADTYLELFDAQQHPLAVSDDDGDSLDAYLEIALETGTYFVAIQSINDTNGYYTLKMTGSAGD